MMSELPKEVEIIHIHAGSEEKKSFYEFLVLSTHRTNILRYDGFVNRNGFEPINRFKRENDS
jgi:hypothetical protein